MSASDLEVVLAFEASRLSTIRDGVGELMTAGREEEERLADLERRLGLASNKESVLPSGVAAPAPRGSDVTLPWAQMVSEARANLSDRGISASEVDLDTLIDGDELTALRSAATSTTPFRCRLDTLDLITATVAGLVAAAVDITIVKIPKTMPSQGQAGSPLTQYLRSKAVPSENWIGDLAKVPFDSLNMGGPVNVRLPPNTHRADTFGHDPLVGVVFGVIDILRGTSTGVGRSGALFVEQIADPVTSNPLVALVLELAHLLSDVATPAGLPLPGWSVLRSINAGSIDGRTIGSQARLMYLRGFDSWHLVTMSTSVASAELVLRAGWALRSAFDKKWSARSDDEARMAGTTRTGSHPRFLMMGLLAHGIAVAANAGKITVLGGNPLAWNAPQWARFAQLVAKWWASQPRTAADAIAARSDINLEQLMEGWPDAPD